MDIQQRLNELQKKYEEVENTNQTLSTRLSELFILYNLTRILTTTFDLNRILPSIFKLFQQSLSVDFSSLLFLDHFAEKLQLQQKYGIAKQNGKPLVFPSPETHLRIVRTKGLLNRIIRSPEEIQIEKGETIPFPAQMLGFPLILSNQEVIGSLCFFRLGETTFNQEQKNFYHTITQELSNILDKLYLFHQTKEDTFRDHLTGVYNRRYFNQRLEMEIRRAERYKRNISILMIDIDNFKQINDRYGHGVGDEVLKKLVYLLKTNLRNSDILVRYGGEEFVALLPETNSQNAYLAGEKLRTAVEKNLSFRTQELGMQKKITISIGVSSYPSDAYSAETLVEKADRHLYFAKGKGKNCTVAAELS